VASGGHNQNVEIVESLRHVVRPPLELHPDRADRCANPLLVRDIGKQRGTNYAEQDLRSIWNRGCDAEKIDMAFLRSDASQDSDSNWASARVPRAKALIRNAVIDYLNRVCAKQSFQRLSCKFRTRQHTSRHPA